LLENGLFNIFTSILCNPVAKSPKKQYEGVRFCHIVKNTLLQTAFSAIFPTCMFNLDKFTADYSFIKFARRYAL